MNCDVCTILRIPEGNIVVTRKVPMTEETCTQLRAIKALRESELALQYNEEVMLPIPVLIQQLINEEAQRII
jgi:hypothetical protein